MSFTRKASLTFFVFGSLTLVIIFSPYAEEVFGSGAMDQSHCEGIADPMAYGDCIDGTLHNEVGVILFPFFLVAALYTLSASLLLLSMFRRMLSRLLKASAAGE